MIELRGQKISLRALEREAVYCDGRREDRLLYGLLRAELV